MKQPMALSPKWSTARLISFRFCFVYFIIYVAPFPLGIIPFVGPVLQFFHQWSVDITTQAGVALLGSDYHPFTQYTGSGDTSHNYMQLLLFVIVSLLATLVWSIIDRRQTQYKRLLYGLMIFLRYYLAVTLLSYGFAKVFKTQFPFPSIDRLNQPIGESSPMGLLWTFMGYSTAYNIFTGMGEVIGGLLLFFKRTRMIGALVAIVVMSHVAMLNFAYDVPVKLYSLHLLALALFLLAPDIKRLVNFFFLNRPVEPMQQKPLYFDTKTKWIYTVAKGLLLLYLIVPQITSTLNNKKQWDTFVERQQKDRQLPGDYEVETFTLNGDTLSPVPDDTRRWKGMSINTNTMNVKHMDGASVVWRFLGNERTHKIMIFTPELSTEGNFTFTNDSTRLILEGVVNQDTLRVISRKKSNNSFLLINRGFHWVNEFPFNQ